MIEPLEARQLMSVSTDDAGFTVVKPSTDSRVVYVSNSTGSDNNSGLSPSSPVKSLAKAASLVRSGMPDQLLMKRGDAWNEKFGYWKKSGRSADEPMVIGAYGEGERPTIRSGIATAIFVGNINNRTINHLSILGIDFHANGRDPSAGGKLSTANVNGISVIANTQGLRIEDCTFEKYQVGITFVPVYGESKGTIVRRCVVANSYSITSSGSHGLFAEGVRNLTLEENTFDHNGWLENVTAAKATIYNHNVYVTANSSGLVAKGNVFSNASSHGLQARAGGVITGNLFLNNPIGLSFGLVNGSGVNVKGGVSGRIEGNVFLGGRDISGQHRGICMEVGNIRAGSGTVIRDNIMSQTYAGSQLWAISLAYGTGTHQADAVGINDLLIERNVVYKWYKGLFVQSGLSPTATGYKRLSNVTVRNNDFVDITKTVYINATALNIDSRVEGLRSIQQSSGGWEDPDRNVSTYMASVLGGTRSAGDFLMRARTRAAGTWDGRFAAEAMVNYVREGFGRSPFAG